MTNVTGNRKHKDRLFISIFQTREELLSLYNAVNNSSYEDPEALEITTIEDVLYMGMKNDVSFLIDGYLNLYEAQSTWNPNMPLRGLFYFSRLYAGYVEAHNLNIYSSVQLKLPTPQYVVFYNGTEKDDERTTLKLSASYEKQGNGEPSLECTATVLNINRGHNKELMEKCRKLYEYSYLIGKIRDYLGLGKTLESAIDLAVDDCVTNGILEEYLRKHRAEVKFMILSEYDEERHMRQTYEEGRAEGERLGRAEGERLGRAEGERLGRAEGEKLGRAEGEKLGRAEGEKLGRAEGEKLGRAEGEKLGRAEGEKLGREQGIKTTLLLLQRLLADGRMEELKKAINDPELDKKIFEEKGL